MPLTAGAGRGWRAAALVGGGAAAAGVGLRLMAIDRLDEVLAGTHMLQAIAVGAALVMGLVVVILIRAAVVVGPAVGVQPRAAIVLASIFGAGIALAGPGLTLIQRRPVQAQRDLAASRCVVEGATGTLRCTDLDRRAYAMVPVGYPLTSEAIHIDVVVRNRDDVASGSGLEVSYEVAATTTLIDVASEPGCQVNRSTTMVSPLRQRVHEALSCD